MKHHYIYPIYQVMYQIKDPSQITTIINNQVYPLKIINYISVIIIANTNVNVFDKDILNVFSYDDDGYLIIGFISRAFMTISSCF